MFEAAFEAGANWKFKNSKAPSSEELRLKCFFHFLAEFAQSGFIDAEKDVAGADPRFQKADFAEFVDVAGTSRLRQRQRLDD